MSTRRQQRVAEQIRIEISQLIERELDDPRLNLINITDATISPDLHDVTLYVSALAGETVKTEVLAGLEHARSFLRRRLGQQMKLRIVPELHFRWDKSLEIGDRISRLIDKIEEQDDPSHQGTGIVPSHQETGIVP
ncbi:MAG TPA: 30S ribosome-binding factor RbfA [Anaerolineae bacterium]|nr:30S ribosome-binding factor RbfA [Anaerolineae bacterium]